MRQTADDNNAQAPGAVAKCPQLTKREVREMARSVRLWPGWLNGRHWVIPIMPKMAIADMPRGEDVPAMQEFETLEVWFDRVFEGNDEIRSLLANYRGATILCERTRIYRGDPIKAVRVRGYQQQR